VPCPGGEHVHGGKRDGAGVLAPYIWRHISVEVV
jgi:hypothetical protein